MATNKLSAFRFDPETLSRLAWLCKDMGLDKSNAVRHLIADAYITRKLRRTKQKAEAKSARQI